MKTALIIGAIDETRGSLIIISNLKWKETLMILKYCYNSNYQSQ